LEEAARTLGAGTLVLPFATVLFSHVLAALLGFAAYAVLLRERDGPPRLVMVAAGGVPAGLAVATEYPLALVAGALALYCAFPWRSAGRALAYLAHQYLGSGFGTVYDVSTICILWFAGASAMAGLLNLVPRYLPRYGMAPEWARAVRPLVLVFAAVSFAITLIFHADVDKQGGAYATGVLVLITSAAVAVTLSVRRTGSRPLLVVFALIALVFAYTTVVNVYERPDGVKIGAFFIGAIVLTSIVSRLRRTTELRVSGVTLDPVAQRFIDEITARTGTVHLIAHYPFPRESAVYTRKLAEQRAEYRIPESDTPLFLEIAVRDASEFAPELMVTGAEVDGYRVLRGESAAVPNAIAALLLHLRDEMGSVPHAYFDWSERSPFGLLVRYVLFGEGDIAPVTHEVLRKAEPNPARRPVIHVS